MIGGLLRFAPGRSSRALVSRDRSMVRVVVAKHASKVELDSEACAMGGLAGRRGRDGDRRRRTARCVSHGWLKDGVG